LIDPQVERSNVSNTKDDHRRTKTPKAFILAIDAPPVGRAWQAVGKSARGCSVCRARQRRRLGYTVRIHCTANQQIACRSRSLFLFRPGHILNAAHNGSSWAVCARAYCCHCHCRCLSVAVALPPPLLLLLRTCAQGNSFIPGINCPRGPAPAPWTLERPPPRTHD
jgi:hypothetical protein